MKTICLYFQVHQPMRLRLYRFFDIGNNHYYYDDYSNESIMRKVAENCYLPANRLFLQLIKEYGTRFKINFSLTGIAMDQMELYAPEVLESFKDLAKTGCVEFLAETYSHSLISLRNKEEFKKQVLRHSEKIKEYFGQTPKVFRNTEMIYSDEIGEMVAEMGFKAMLTEGAKHVLGWKSPNFLYCNVNNPRLKLLLKNFKLSDDIAFRFSNTRWPEYPLTADKYVGWLNKIEEKEEVINLFMDYETFGEHQNADTGIFEFLKALPKALFKKSKFQLSTVSEVADELQPVAPISVPYPISWADEERDLTAWLGNELQKEAFEKLYCLVEKIENCQDPIVKADWKYLQASDHFYYMSTKFFSDGEVHSYFNPYNSPYDAFINYMNVLSDFTIRLNACVPETDKDKEIANLIKLLVEKEALLEKYEKQFKGAVTPKTASQPKSMEVPKTPTGRKKTVAKKKTAPAKMEENKSNANKQPTVKVTKTKGPSKVKKAPAPKKEKITSEE
jgi:alpha-amylase